MERLKKYGLIEYRPGRQHKFLKTAGEIKRVIPIPATNVVVGK